MLKKSTTIPGIGDYCNEWCERCTMIRFCSSHIAPPVEDPMIREEYNIAFWQKSNIPPANLEYILERVAQKQGKQIDALAAAERVHYDLTKKAENEYINNHPIKTMTIRYMRTGGTWLHFIEKYTGIYVGEADYLNNKIIRAPALIREEDAETFFNLEIIEWHLYFIYSKASRALNSYFEYDGWELANGMQRGYDGSAKVALLSIERSIYAWINLHNLVPGCEYGIFESVAILYRLKKMLEDLSPDAMMYLRPGFDKPNPDGIPFKVTGL